MGLINTVSSPNTPVDMGSPLQCELSATDINLALSVAASGTSASNIILNGGFKSFAFATKSTEAGSISIQRYLDQAATIPQGAAITASLTANTDAVANNVDGKPFQSMIITVSNSGGSTATLTNTLLLLQAS